MYTLLHICIYAYVSFKDGKREIVPTENIRHFDPANFDKNKLYNILWKDKHYYEGAIAFVRETEQEVKDEISTKRTNVRPIESCLTASEISEDEVAEKKQPDPKGHTDVIKRKVELLKLKQIEKKRKRDTVDKINTTKKFEIEATPSEEMSNDKEKDKENKSAAANSCKTISFTEKNDNCTEIKKKYARVKEKNIDLEQRLKKKDAEIEALKTQAEQERVLIAECMRTCVDFQKQVIAEFNEMKDIVRHLRQNNSETADPNGAYLAVGSQRKEGLMENVHIGRDLWIPAGQFDTLLCQKKPTVFVKELAKIVIGDKTLEKSTVTGKISNRSKGNNIVPEKLDGRKLAAIKDSLAFFLSTNYFDKMDMVTKQTHLNNVGNYISAYIADLKKKKRIQEKFAFAKKRFRK